jgi:hypothetical protein
VVACAFMYLCVCDSDVCFGLGPLASCLCQRGLGILMSVAPWYVFFFWMILYVCMGKRPQTVGLIVSERLINMPVQTAPPMFRMLLEELQWACEDVRSHARVLRERDAHLYADQSFLVCTCVYECLFVRHTLTDVI